MNRVVTIAAVSLLLTGCASSASNISASYVSPLQYNSYSCRQLEEEAARIATRAGELTGTQNTKAVSDAVATGVAIVIFWPAAFLVSGNGATAAELGRLKGELEAIEKVSIQKNCKIKIEREPVAPKTSNTPRPIK